MFKCWSPKQLPPGQATILNQFYRSFTVFPGGRRKVWNVMEEKRVEGRWLCLCLTKSLWNLFCQLFSVIYCLHTHTHTYTLFRGLRSSFSSYFPLKNKLQLGATPLDEVLMSVHTPIHTHTHTHTHFNILRPGCFHHTCYFRSRATVRMRNFCHLCSLQFDNESPTSPKCQVLAADFNFGHLMSGWPPQRFHPVWCVCNKKQGEKNVKPEGIKLKF